MAAERQLTSGRDEHSADAVTVGAIPYPPFDPAHLARKRQVGPGGHDVLGGGIAGRDGE
jgi:hypothetical protein